MPPWVASKGALPLTPHPASATLRLTFAIGGSGALSFALESPLLLLARLGCLQRLGGLGFLLLLGGCGGKRWAGGQGQAAMAAQPILLLEAGSCLPCFGNQGWSLTRGWIFWDCRLNSLNAQPVGY